jgi:hypothetical protein
MAFLLSFFEFFAIFVTLLADFFLILSLVSSFHFYLYSTYFIIIIFPFFSNSYFLML